MTSDILDISVYEAIDDIICDVNGDFSTDSIFRCQTRQTMKIVFLPATPN